MQNTIENLELKLAQTRKEKAEISEKVEKDFVNNYETFLKEIFDGDFLGVKKYISAYFQIEKIDFLDKSDTKILKNALEKTTEIIPINQDKKDLFVKKVLYLKGKKEFLETKLLKKSSLQKDINFPIIESLEKSGFLNKNDIFDLSLAYKKNKDFLDSLSVLSELKKKVVKSHIFDLNNTKTEERVKNFKSDFKEEIENSKLIIIYPRVLEFIGRNYTKLKLKNKVETKKERLKRIFKIAFLKLYRLKYSGIDIISILNKIENLDDLDEFLSLLIKFFERLKQNPTLSQDYVVLDEVDEFSEIKAEAEENKEKSLFAEEKIIKASSLVEEAENKLTFSDLDKILSEKVDLVGEEFILREEEKNAGILTENDILGEDDEEDEIEKDVDLNLLFKELKQKLFELEEEKRKLFLSGNYDKIDELNDELVELIKKLEKLKKLLGIVE